MPRPHRGVGQHNIGHPFPTAAPAPVIVAGRGVRATGRRAQVALVALSAAVLVAACAGDGSRPAGSLEPATVSANGGARAAFADIVPRVRAAVVQLMESPSVVVTYRVTGAESGEIDGAGTVSPLRQAYQLMERITGDSFAFTHERRLLDGVLYLRDIEDGTDPATVPWTTVAYQAEGARDAAGSLTARGRAVPDLDRLVVLLESVPFTARRLEGVADMYALSASLEAVEEFYRQSGLEQVEGRDEPLGGSAGGGRRGEDQVQFGVGFDSTGTLAWLQASGSVLYDGEVLDGALVDVRYAPAGAEIAVEAPIHG